MSRVPPTAKSFVANSSSVGFEPSGCAKLSSGAVGTNETRGSTAQFRLLHRFRRFKLAAFAYS